MSARSQAAGDSSVNASVAAGHDSFVFASSFGQATAADFVPETDTTQFNHATFANVSAVPVAARDDTHGNAVITYFSHDTLTIQNITAAQFHVHQNDFHFM